MVRLLAVIILALALRLVSGADTGQELEAIRLRIESGKSNPAEGADLSLLEGWAFGNTAFAGRATAVLAFFHRLKGTPERIQDKLKTCALKKDGAWNMDERECCLEYARLKAQEDFSAAMNVIDKLGQSGSGIQRLLAAEAAGDVLLAGKQFQAAEEAYRLAKKIFQADEYLRDDLLAKLALERVWKGLAAARRPLDVEKYGEDFVLYREAEENRNWKNYAQALARYDEIIKAYPQTVYAVASECYAIDCLLALYRETECSKAAQVIEKAKGRLKELIQQLRDGQRRGLPAGALEQLAKKIRAQETLIRSLEMAPTGPKAASLAEERAAAFLKREPAGLYRGEVHVMLGRHYLDAAFNPARAEDYFSRAAKWCAEINQNPEKRAGLEVPEKARQVSAPPPHDRARDDWSNVKVQEPKPGDIVNQTTCAWYVRRLHREAVLKWGLTAYARGDLALAKQLWESLYEIDPYFAEAEKTVWRSSVVALLLWSLKNRPGCLYVEPAEMASFVHPGMRLGVLQADLAFCNNEFPVAEGKYRALLAEPFGRLTKPQRAFLTYALARSLDMQFKEEEVEKLIEGFDKQFAGTPTLPRFLLWRGDRATFDLTNPGTPRPTAWAAGIRDFAELLRQYPHTEDADYALYHWGWKLYLLNEFDQARERFETYLRQYPQGIHKEQVLYYLDASTKRIPDQ